MALKLNSEEFRNIVVEHMTLKWLEQNNLDPSDPKTPAIELDLDREDSQAHNWKLTAEEAYDYFLEALEKIEKSGYEVADSDDEAGDPVSDYVHDNFGGEKTQPAVEQKTEPSGAVHKSSMISLFMRTPPGVPTYVGDVREWVAEVNSLNIPDEVEVEGELFLTYDQDIITSEVGEEEV